MCRQQAKKDLENLKSGQECFITQGEGGGAKVCKVQDTYVLYEIPQFGGTPRHEGTFCDGEEGKLIEAALSWV